MNYRKIFVRRDYGYVGKKMHTKLIGPFKNFEEAVAYGKDLEGKEIGFYMWQRNYPSYICPAYEVREIELF